MLSIDATANCHSFVESSVTTTTQWGGGETKGYGDFIPLSYNKGWPFVLFKILKELESNIVYELPYKFLWPCYLMAKE